MLKNYDAFSFDSLCSETKGISFFWQYFKIPFSTWLSLLKNHRISNLEGILGITSFSLPCNVRFFFFFFWSVSSLDAYLLTNCRAGSISYNRNSQGSSTKKDDFENEKLKTGQKMFNVYYFLFLGLITGSHLGVSDYLTKLIQYWFSGIASNYPTVQRNPQSRITYALLLS